jgi:hypothetical protein
MQLDDDNFDLGYWLGNITDGWRVRWTVREKVQGAKISVAEQKRRVWENCFKLKKRMENGSKSDPSKEKSRWEQHS